MECPADVADHFIAHRLSTNRDAGRILVVRGGNTVEQGTHDDLLRRNGVHAERYTSHFERVPVEAGA